MVADLGEVARGAVVRDPAVAEGLEVSASSTIFLSCSSYTETCNSSI